MVVLGIIQLASSDTSNLGFLIINIAIALIVAGLIWRFGSWALVLGAIAGLLGTGLAYGPYLILSTGSVNSVFDFGVAVVTTVGSIMALVGSIVAFVQLRARHGSCRGDGSRAQRVARCHSGGSRDSPDQTNFPGYSSFWDTVKYNPAFQGRQMRPNSLKFPVFI